MFNYFYCMITEWFRFFKIKGWTFPLSCSGFSRSYHGLRRPPLLCPLFSRCIRGKYAQ